MKKHLDEVGVAYIITKVKTLVNSWLSGAMSWTPAQMKQARANLGFGNGDIDNDPTAGSNNLVKSGGVQNELALGAVYDVSAKNPTAGSNNDGKWESLSALLSDANLSTLIPASVRKGGMSVKFIQSSDNKYVQFRCMAQNFTTDVTQWQGVDIKPFLGSKNIVESGGVDNAILAISSHELEDYIPDYEFEKGIYNSSGEKTNLNYRVRTKNIVTNNGILAIVPKTGWQVLVNIYVNNVLSESIGYTSGKVDLSEAQQFTLSIKRAVEDTSEIADVNEFISGLTAQSKGISQVNFDALKKIVDKTIIYNLESILDFGNFERGSYNSSGQKVSVVNRIRLKEPVSLEQNIFIIPQDGWEVNICTFNGNNVASYINYTSEKVLIEANTSFVLTIKKKAETSDAASVSVFVSGVKAQTECSSKNDVDKLKGVLLFPLDDFISVVNFEKGYYDSSGTAVNLSYRIRTKELSVINNDIQIVPKYGWRVGVLIYQNSSLSTNIDLSTEPIYIKKNKTFKLVIARVTENTSENADIATFMAGIAVLSTCTSNKDGDTLKNAVNKYLPYDSRFALCAMDFKRGRLNGSGEFETGYNYRITSEDILQYPEALTIRCSEGNFLTSIAYFDSEGVFVKMDSYSDEDKYIAPNQKFRLSIRRVTEVTSEQANNREFLAGIKTTTLSAPYSALSSFVNTNGKIINFLGDSYVANHEDTFEEGWCYKFGKKHNMVARNYGKNGYPITPESESGHVNISYIATTMADADYIVVVGGKNDYNAQVPITTFKDAVSNLIEYIIGRWPTVQLCFFTPWKVSEETETTVGQTAKTIPLFDYIDTIKDVCSEYGVACYDTANSGIYTWDADFRHLYFQSDNDISHLNPDGHDLFLPRAEKFLMTVLG